MKEIYGCYTDRFGNLFLDLFEDYDAETERKECSECFNDAWDYGGELDPNCEKRIDLHAYFAARDPFEFDAKYDNPFWSADV